MNNHPVIKLRRQLEQIEQRRTDAIVRLMNDDEAKRLRAVIKEYGEEPVS